MEKQRLVWADVLKGILIILVVLGHAIQNTLGDKCFDDHLWNIIYSFHMPAFIAVSGFFAYHNNQMKKVSVNSFVQSVFRRFRQLVIPFVLWTIISLLIDSNLSWSSFFRVLLYPDSGLWFLWVLFVISFLFSTCIWLSGKNNEIYSLVSLGVILIIVMIVSDLRMFGFQFIAYYYLFYLIGFALHKYEHSIIISSKLVLVLLSLCWALMAWYWNMHSLPSFMQGLPFPTTLAQYCYRFITAVIAVYVLFSVLPSLFKVVSRWNVPFVLLGVNSLGIYATHFILMRKLVGLYRSFEMCSGVIITCSFISGLVISWGIVWLLSKWTITNKLLIGKV